MLTVRKGSRPFADYYATEQLRAEYYGKAGEVTASPEMAETLGIDLSRDMSTEELDQLMSGKRADGRLIENSRPRQITFADFTFSAGKSLSVQALVLAPTEAEREALIKAHQAAAEDAIGYVEHRMAITRTGTNGIHKEKGEWAAVGFDHFTSRPVRDKNNGITIDPNIHRHYVVPTVVRLPDGRTGALDLGQLRGVVKEGGAVYQASLSRHLRDLGVRVHLGKNGEAVLTDVPQRLVEEFSRRDSQVGTKAKEIVKAKGLDWNRLSERQQRDEKRSAALDRQNKLDKDQASLDGEWGYRSRALGYDIRPAIRGQRQRHSISPQEEA